MSLHYLHSHIDFFPENPRAISEEQSEHFHQDLMVMESRYQERWNANIMAAYGQTTELNRNQNKRILKKSFEGCGINYHK